MNKLILLAIPAACGVFPGFCLSQEDASYSFIVSSSTVPENSFIRVRENESPGNARTQLNSVSLRQVGNDKSKPKVTVGSRSELSEQAKLYSAEIASTMLRNDWRIVQILAAMPKEMESFRSKIKKAATVQLSLVKVEELEVDDRKLTRLYISPKLSLPGGPKTVRAWVRGDSDCEIWELGGKTMSLIQEAKNWNIMY